LTEKILGNDYSFCFAQRKCDTKSWISDIYLYFNGTKSDSITDKNFTQYILTLKKANYAVDATFSLNISNVTTNVEGCKFLVYGQNSSMEDRYLIGNALLNSYYVMLNYTDNTIGFNGDYSEVVYKPDDPIKPNPKPPAPDNKKKSNPVIIIAIIAGALLFVAIGVCIYIKKRNESINQELTSNAKYHTIGE